MPIDENEAGSGDDDAPLSALQLGVRGYACRIFDDARVAWALHGERHLIPWRAGSDLRVDRFDARNLLDDHALFRRLKRPRARTNAIATSAADGEDSSRVSDKELHALRYGDYAIEFPPPPRPEPKTPPANAFAYAYPEDRDDGDDEGNGEAYEPPWVVPESIEQPKSKKLHEIIAATAKKAREHPQLEVMLKVKLSATARFGFLDATHGFHAYYTFLRDESPPLRVAAAATEGTNTVSLLGEEYGDDSDEDKDEEAEAEADADADATLTAETETETEVPSVRDEKQAMRLKRAKLLAGHFQRAALETKAHSPTALETATRRRERSQSPDSQVKRPRHRW